MGRANVLIVDDDSDIVEVLAYALELEGYAVRTAGTGEEGLRVLRSASLPPDAILLDVDMPVLDGPAMAHNMLVHDAGEEDIPIVLFSAKPDLPAIAARLGTPYWLAKPFGLEGLRAVLGLAIREHVAPAHP